MTAMFYTIPLRLPDDSDSPMTHPRTLVLLLDSSATACPVITTARIYVDDCSDQGLGMKICVREEQFKYIALHISVVLSGNPYLYFAIESKKRLRFQTRSLLNC